MPHCKKQLISFFMTTECNLRCTYCYNQETRKKSQSLPLEIAKAGIDEYFAKNTSRHIRFYGPGEPTEEFDTMCKIVEYAKEQDENVTVEIQTNGAFSKEKREWILKNMNYVWISFDGTPDIQNKQRPFPHKQPSAPTIEDNVRWLVSHNMRTNFMVGARVTITDLNVDRQKDMVNYFCGMGMKNIWSDPVFPEVKDKPFFEDKKRAKKFHFDIDSYVTHFIKTRQYAYEIGVFYGSFLTCNFDGKSKVHCRACTPVPHLTTDGYVSACDLVVYGENANHMDCFIYGKWNDKDKKFDYNQEKIKALQDRNIDNIEHCKDCIAKLHCGGQCLGEVQNETGKLNGQKKEICKAIITLYKELGECEEYKYMHP